MITARACSTIAGPRASSSTSPDDAQRSALGSPDGGADDTEHRAGDRGDPGVDRARRDREPIAGRPDQRELARRRRRTPYFVRIPGAVDRAPRRRPGQRAPQHASRRPRPGCRRGSSPPSPAWDVFVARVGATAGRCRTRRFARAGDADPRRRRRCAASTPGRASATTSTCSASRSATCAVVDERAIRIPAGYREHLGTLPADRGGARRPRRCRRVPCHNDLLAENYLDDGARLWIVDYEYSGNGDPAFELGNTCQELGCDDAQVARAVRRLLRRGHPRPARPDAPADDHVRRRLDAVGGHPGAHLDDRLRLLRLGRGALGARDAMLDGPDFEGWLARRAAELTGRPGQRARAAALQSGAAARSLRRDLLERVVDVDAARRGALRWRRGTRRPRDSRIPPTTV